MKKLLFMYPICNSRYLGSFTIEKRQLLEKVIEERYRKKGYQVYFLNFGDMSRDDLHFVKMQDVVISGTMDFDWNTKRLMDKRVFLNKSFEECQEESKRMLQHIDYPSFEHIVDELCPQEKVVVAGVDPYNTPFLFTQYMQKMGYDAELDVELGQNFPRHSQSYGFMLDTYNPKNIVMNDEVETLYKQGISLHKRWSSFLLENPVYRISLYEPTISRIDSYFYQLCTDVHLDVSRRSEFLANLQYLLHICSKSERMEFQKKMLYSRQDYVEFLFYSCFDRGAYQFFFVLELLKDFIGNENVIDFEQFKHRRDLGNDFIVSRETVVSGLADFKKYLLENPRAISCHTGLFCQDIKLKKLVDFGNSR